MDWVEENENLLCEWAETARFYAWMHHRTSEYYYRLNNSLSLPLIIFGTISGSANFTLVGNKTSSYLYTTIIPFIIGFLNLLTVVLSASTKFLKCAELSENHIEFYKQYTKLVRNICLELALPPNHRKHSSESSHIFRNEFDRLISESPNIPQFIIVEFNNKFPYKKNKPSIANSFEKIKIFGRKKHIKSLETKFRNIRHFYRWVYITKLKDALLNTHPPEHISITQQIKDKNKLSLDFLRNNNSTDSGFIKLSRNSINNLISQGKETLGLKNKNEYLDSPNDDNCSIKKSLGSIYETSNSTESEDINKSLDIV
jgi:hypothetical protein